MTRSSTYLLEFQREDGWCESLFKQYGSSLWAVNRTREIFSRLQRPFPPLPGKRYRFSLYWWL